MIDKKGFKIFIHASALFAPMLVPILMWLLVADREIKRTAREAFFFHLVMFILIGISKIFSFILIGIPFLILFGLMYVIVPIFAIIVTSKGRDYHYPIVG